MAISCCERRAHWVPAEAQPLSRAHSFNLLPKRTRGRQVSMQVVTPSRIGTWSWRSALERVAVPKAEGHLCGSRCHAVGASRPGSRSPVVAGRRPYLTHAGSLDSKNSFQVSHPCRAWSAPDDLCCTWPPVPSKRPPVTGSVPRLALPWPLPWGACDELLVPIAAVFTFHSPPVFKRHPYCMFRICRGGFEEVGVAASHAQSGLVPRVRRQAEARP